MSHHRTSTALVSWSQVATATGYRVFWGTSSRNYSYLKDVGANASYRVPGLNRNTTYYFSAKAYNKLGVSPFSPEAVWKT